MKYKIGEKYSQVQQYILQLYNYFMFHRDGLPKSENEICRSGIMQKFWCVKWR
jgi:hypothetical protein